MSTSKQLDANRRNAQKSTGPKTPAGKAASCMNALKTGIHAKSAIIKGEKAEDLQDLIEEYYSHHQPDTPELRAIVDDLIVCEWEIRRITHCGAQMWNHQVEDSWEKAKYPTGKVAANNHKSHLALQRRLDSTRRGRDRALKLLREHRTNPIPTPEPAPGPDPTQTIVPPATSPEIGFVPPTPSEPPAVPDSLPDSHPEVVLS